MNDRLENQYSMLLAVQAFYLGNQVAIDALPAATPIFTQLSSYLVTIGNNAGAASADITGHAADKAASRLALTQIVLKVGNGFSAWCALNNNKAKAELFDESESSLNAMRDTALYAYSKSLEVEANAEIANLADYLILPADITALSTAAANYLALIPDPKFKKSAKSALGSLVANEIGLAMALVRDQLDKTMKIFLSIDPVLYQTYENVRRIDDTGSVSSPDYEGDVPASTTTAVVDLAYQGSRTFYVTNVGPASFSFALSTMNNALEGEIVTVDPGQQSQRLSSNLNPNPLANYLVIQNTDPIQNASYEVRITE